MSMDSISEQNLEKHLSKLVDDIGVRLSGHPGEKKAADYIASVMEDCGGKVSIEEFPMRSRVVTSQHLEIEIKDAWDSFACSLHSHTPGTDGQTIEAPVVFFESTTEYNRDTLEHLAGKAVVHLGCHIESRVAYRKLITAKPAFVMMVDIRFPGTHALADGFFPSYVDELGAVPMVNLAYMDAWRMKTEGATSARLNVQGGMEPATSQNVIADFPGTDESSKILFLGAHHDTQADSVGADDNGTGVIGVLELARVLADQPRKRPLRVISFGCEEQLSVGSAAYVRTHREELEERGGFMFNLDSYGSYMGWNDLVANGPETMGNFISNHFKRVDQYLNVMPRIMPYADHFPFVATGIPSVSLLRSNCTGGRFFHHRPDDDASRVSIPLVATLLNAVASTMEELGNADELPFEVDVPKDQKDQVDAFWVDLFGGW